MEDCSLNRAQVAFVLPWVVLVLALVGAHGGLQPEPAPSSGCTALVSVSVSVNGSSWRTAA